MSLNLESPVFQLEEVKCVLFYKSLLFTKRVTMYPITVDLTFNLGGNRESQGSVRRRLVRVTESSQLSIVFTKYISDSVYFVRIYR